MPATFTFDAFLKDCGTAARSDTRCHKSGEVGRQGDVYLHPIKEKPPAWDVEETIHHQVALGQTQGARHCASKARVFWPSSAAEARKQLPLTGFMQRRKEPVGETEIESCIGPVVIADEEWTLTHPTHAHHSFPAGTYLVTYQFDERTRRRVAD